MMNKIFFLLSSMFLLVSCNQSEIYRKIDDNFPQNRWETKDSKSYNFTITDESKAYNIIFLFSHVYDYQFDEVPVVFKITDPSGKSEEILVNLKIKDANGKQLADCGGDFCDLKHNIKEKTTLQKGMYTITASQRFNGPFLPNVLGVGIVVNIAN